MNSTQNNAGKLVGKVALVTGAANGIGRAISERFASEGAQVVIADINSEAAQAVAAHINESGGTAEAVTCDVSQASDVSNAVEHAVSAFGRLTTIVGGAAVFTPVLPMHEVEQDEWQRALDVNITGCFLVSKYAIPYLKQTAGTIILIASQMARVANAGQSVYCATKGALVQLAKGMALDYAKDGSRVNTLSPGGVATDRLVQRFGDLEQAQRIWGAKQPMGRLGEPDEIARGAVFLACDDATFMTGADLLVDGGYTAW